MLPFGPTKRRVLIEIFRELGFEGPCAGCRHQFMTRGDLRITILNPHQRDIGVGLLKTVLSEAGITRDEWERL
jgi:hypothetical protein